MIYLRTIVAEPRHRYEETGRTFRWTSISVSHGGRLHTPNGRSIRWLPPNVRAELERSSREQWRSDGVRWPNVVFHMASIAEAGRRTRPRRGRVVSTNRVSGKCGPVVRAVPEGGGIGARVVLQDHEEQRAIQQSDSDSARLLADRNDIRPLQSSRVCAWLGTGKSHRQVWYDAIWLSDILCCAECCIRFWARVLVGQWSSELSRSSNRASYTEKDYRLKRYGLGRYL